MNPQQEFKEIFQEGINHFIFTDDPKHSRDFVVHQIKITPNVDQRGSVAITRFIINAILDTLI